jgi:hypothetical protein
MLFVLPAKPNPSGAFYSPPAAFLFGLLFLMVS